MKKDQLYKYEITVDGKKLGILFDNPRTQKELKRIKDLKGVHIKKSLVI